MRTKRITLIAVMMLLSFTVGCSTIGRWEFALGAKLEQQGRYRTASRLYAGALSRIPAGDSRLRSETYFHLGNCLWALGQAGEAFNAFQMSVEADNTNIAARLRLGEMFLAGGAVDRASEQAAAVLEAGHNNTEALALLGAASSAAGENELAIAAFRKVLADDPRRISIGVALADIYNRIDREDEARKVLNQLATAEPGSSMPLLALGRLEEQEGNVDAAEQAYRGAVRREDTPDTNLRLAQFLERSSRVDEAEKILQKVDRMRPSNPTALPDFELLAGRLPNAMEQYLTAMRSGALDHPRGDTPETQARAAVAARIIEADVEAASAAGDPMKAAAVAHLHLDQFRNDLDQGTIAILQAEVALVEGDISAAELHAGTAVQLAPKSAASHYVLGVVRHRAGDAPGAHRAWLDAVEEDSSFVPARLALAAEALAADDATVAEHYVLPTVREEPGNMRALTLYARVLLAEKRLNSATAIAKRAATVDPNSSEPSVILGEIALADKKYAESLQRFEEAVVEEPHSPDALQGLIRVYRQGVVTRPMLRNMEAVAAKQPASATLMEIAGRLYSERGWNADAERCFNRALAIDPRRSTAAAALAKLFAAHGQIDAATESATKLGGNTGALISGLTAQQRNDVETAIQQYEAAVRGGEHTGVAANNLAWLYAQQGTRLDRALSLAQRARTQAPKDPAVLDTVGVVHLRRREYTQAVEVLKDAVQLASSPAYSAQPELVAEIHRHLSEAYLRAGIVEPPAIGATSHHDALRQRLSSPAIVPKRASE